MLGCVLDRLKAAGLAARATGKSLGPLLIGFGAVGAVYILQSATNPWLFGAGVFWEGVIYLVNLVLILTFPKRPTTPARG